MFPSGCEKNPARGFRGKSGGEPGDFGGEYALALVLSRFENETLEATLLNSPEDEAGKRYLRRFEGKTLLYFSPERDGILSGRELGEALAGESGSPDGK